MGTSEQVKMRRSVKEVGEILGNQSKAMDDRSVVRAGSFSEGFRLPGLDRDAMFWPNDHRMIWDLSQTQYYQTPIHKLILALYSDSPPGYTLLQLMTPTNRTEVLSACVIINNRPYVSSSLYRHINCSRVFPNSTIHGPCGSGNISGYLEYDTAQGFACDLWPPLAYSWVDRCQSWPKPHVVYDIVRSGCHVVPIGHKLGRHEINEWRISFCVAEMKLVSSMSHCQFLTYGLLKLFLKEVIHPKTGVLLSSYHMKTAVFLGIIQLHPQCIWCPQNLIENVWVCFKLIIKWVYEGVCSNFFIPENNMFLTKIYGSAKEVLFRYLYGFYERGTVSLLDCPSVKCILMNVLFHPRIISTDECSCISEVMFDKELFTDIYNIASLQAPTFCVCLWYLNTVHQMCGLQLTEIQALTLQYITSTVLQSAAFILRNILINPRKNKFLYLATTKSCHMTKIASNLGFVSDLLYVAMHYYKSFRFKKALSVLEIAQTKLSRPYVMLLLSLNTSYTEAVGGQPLFKKMGHAIAYYIKLSNKICYIDELIIEQQSSLQNRKYSLSIPHIVLLRMLQFLCYRHFDMMKAQAVLDNLQHLLLEHTVCILNTDIAWQILGICQHVTGNYKDAINSYKRSLKQIPHHKIKTATYKRIKETLQCCDLTNMDGPFCGSATLLLQKRRKSC
ncbi:uncharacterized protein LOC133200860 [Saccostrea echinata]|uniref:uncharacterized protein LOC133200860 n=1 Tax=Saccostrea echinata TaxID=191078 RepID=UPI002A819C70|nr:uncharacterized protein LOC133200860 [Saccostrea echinata]